MDDLVNETLEPQAVEPISSDSVLYRQTTDTISNVIDTKAPIASPEFTGAPKATTAAYGDNSTRIATTAFVKNVRGVTTVNDEYPDENGNVEITPAAIGAATANHVHQFYASWDHTHAASEIGLGNVTNESKETMFDSPAFTGTPTAPTPADGDNSTRIATTAFVNSVAGAGSEEIGNLENLSTTAKNNLVAAINELFQLASEGKTAIANAITAKGVSASASDTFTALATKIGQIKRALGNAVASNVLYPKTFTNSNGVLTTGSMPNNGTHNITPSTVNQTIPAGYTNGGTVYGDAKLIPANIKSGVSIFGVSGSLIPGRQFAYGTFVATQVPGGESIVRTANLAFTPRIVMVYTSAGPIYIDLANGQINPTTTINNVTLTLSDISGTQAVKLTYANASTTAVTIQVIKWFAIA